MIKDLIVNLAIGAERDPARDYALTIAEAFGAHIVGMAFAYEHVLPGYVLGGLPAELVTEAMLQHQKAVEAAVERFDAAAKRGLLSAEHIVNKVLERDVPVVLASAARRFDLSVVMQSEPDGVDNDRLIEGLLFESGRPVNIVPYIQRDGLKPRPGGLLLGRQSARGAGDQRRLAIPNKGARRRPLHRCQRKDQERPARNPRRPHGRASRAPRHQSRSKHEYGARYRCREHDPVLCGRFGRHHDRDGGLWPLARARIRPGRRDPRHPGVHDCAGSHVALKSIA